MNKRCTCPIGMAEVKSGGLYYTLGGKWKSAASISSQKNGSTSRQLHIVRSSPERFSRFEDAETAGIECAKSWIALANGVSVKQKAAFLRLFALLDITHWNRVSETSSIYDDWWPVPARNRSPRSVLWLPDCKSCRKQYRPFRWKLGVPRSLRHSTEFSYSRNCEPHLPSSTNRRNEILGDYLIS